MIVIVILLLVNFLVYIFTILWLINGFSKVADYEQTIVEANKTTFSIIIPFRNEAVYLPHFLESIAKIDYPKELFELIFVNDDSTDDSAVIITKWRMENGLFQTTVLDNLRISNSPKKDAIVRAMPVIYNDWVITTDADCVLSLDWLRIFDNYIQSNEVKMVVGSVGYDTGTTFLHRFQLLDFLSLQAATIGGFGLKKPFMCNGANFAYAKDFFLQLKGFDGNSSIASGDDVFLLHKAIQVESDKVHYLKSNAHTVYTRPVNSIKALFNQRVRWASKSTNYNNDFGEFVALSVFFGNLSLLIMFFLCVFSLESWIYFILLFLIKFSFDFVFILKANAFLNNNNNKRIFPIFCSFLYLFFSSGIALYSIVGKYEWKGRKFKK